MRGRVVESLLGEGQSLQGCSHSDRLRNNKCQPHAGIPTKAAQDDVIVGCDFAYGFKGVMCLIAQPLLVDVIVDSGFYLAF